MPGASNVIDAQAAALVGAMKIALRTDGAELPFSISAFGSSLFSVELEVGQAACADKAGVRLTPWPDSSRRKERLNKTIAKFTSLIALCLSSLAVP